jgi:predicted ATPase
MKNFVAISGCSGGGKSTLLAELKQHGFAVVEEPGRRVVKHQVETGGSALPWTDGAAFARKALALAWDDWRAARALGGGVVFFDRGLIDAAVALAHFGGGWPEGDFAHAYGPLVFLAPPWPEIYVGDPERRHGLAEAEGEYRRLAAAYARLGYETVVLPKADVAARLRFVLARLMIE